MKVNEKKERKVILEEEKVNALEAITCTTTNTNQQIKKKMR